MIDKGQAKLNKAEELTKAARLKLFESLSMPFKPEDKIYRPETYLDCIQPNFEVMATRGTSWNTRWQLSQFATLECQYPDYKYRFEKTSLLEGMKKGLTVDKVLVFS